MAHDCEPSGCFRPDQRNRRVRPGAQDRPYATFTTAAPTAPTTTTTTVAPNPHPYNFLLNKVKIPDSGAICPAIETTAPPMLFEAVGGDKQIISNNLIIHKFDSDGSFTIFPYDDEQENFEATINVLLVGGGGGGGPYNGAGGGGAGEVLNSTYQFPKGSVSIVIGSGGDVGFNGLPSTISLSDIKALGGGAGGSAFLDDAQRGASGGGAGGRSDKLGAIGLRGNNGGASIGNVGGGGGGGAGEKGQNAGAVKNAGAGGDGIAITLDKGKTYTYYGGGGAGDAFTSVSINGGLGGGGSTFAKDGVDGLGGGGAGYGGSGGKGYCVISYKPLTTPPPTTTTTTSTTTPKPEVCLSSGDLSGSIDVTISNGNYVFNDISSKDYIFKASTGIYTFNNVPDSHPIAFHSADENIIYTGTTSNGRKPALDGVVREYYHGTVTLDVRGDFNTISYECWYHGYMGGRNNLVYDSGCPSPTTTTTTIPPTFNQFRIDYQDFNVGSGYCEKDVEILAGPPDETRTTSVSLKGDSDKVFYSAPLISFAGEGRAYVAEEFSIPEISPDNTTVNYPIVFTMPDQPETRLSVFFTGDAVDVTTTSTTTTTTTKAPLCTAMYHTATITENQDGSCEQTPEADRLLFPRQIMISRNQFPKEITGTSINDTNSQLIGSPWYNGLHFDIARNLADSQVGALNDALPDDYKMQLPYGDNQIHNNIFYRLHYPQVLDNTVIDESLFYTIYSETNVGYFVRLQVISDYICTVESPDKCGKGSQSVSGFTRFTFSELLDGVENVLHNDIVSTYNYRTYGTFTSEVLNSLSFYYLIDFGTRESVVGAG